MKAGALILRFSVEHEPVDASESPRRLVDLRLGVDSEVAAEAADELERAVAAIKARPPGVPSSSKGPSLADLMASVRAGDPGTLEAALRKMAQQAGVAPKAPPSSPPPFPVGTRVKVAGLRVPVPPGMPVDVEARSIIGRAGVVTALCDAGAAGVCRHVMLDGETVAFHLGTDELELAAGAAGENLS